MGPNVIDPLQARYQPKGSNQCGQACVATVLDIDLDKAVKLVGKKGLTRTVDIRKAFAEHDIRMGPRVNPKKVERNTVYMARIHWPKGKKTHWVAIDLDGTVFDPGWGFNPHTEGGWPPGSRITSLYPLDFSERERLRTLEAAIRLLDGLKLDHFTSRIACRKVEEATALLQSLRLLR